MFPIRDDNPQIYTPYTTYGLIAANLIAWLLLQGLGTQPQLSQSICQYGLIPADLLSNYFSQRATCPIDNIPNWETLISAMFMHGSWMHLIGNLWFLWIFGDNVEDAMGSIRFFFFYILCGLFAAAAQIVVNTSSSIPMVGASGAIGGIMGAYIVLYPKVHVHMFAYLMTFSIPAVAMLGYWILVQVLEGVSSMNAQGGVAFWAHIGGFAAGALLIFIFKNDNMLKQHPYKGWSQKRHKTALWKNVKREDKHFR